MNQFWVVTIPILCVYVGAIMGVWIAYIMTKVDRPQMRMKDAFWYGIISPALIPVLMGELIARIYKKIKENWDH